jgi:putative ABC transport system permease protein
MILDARFVTRELLRDPGHTLVSLLGLSIGLAFCALVLGYVRYAWSYDAHVPHADRVYVLKHKRNWEIGKAWSDQAPMAMRETARSIHGIEEVTGYTNWFPLVADIDGRLVKLRNLTALPGLPEMLGLEALHGDVAAALSRPDSVAITEAGARRLFGTPNVLGKELKLRLNAADTNVATVSIGAVLPTPPSNTTIPFEMINGLELTLLPKWAKDEALLGTIGYQGGYLLARVAPGASVDDITRSLQELGEKSPLVARVPDSVKAHAGKDKFVEVKLSPLRMAHLDHEVAINVFSTDVPRGDPRVIAGLAAAALLLLVLAAINYVNLATIRVIRRQREIALRKLLGISRRRIALQFVAESIAVSLLAVIIGIGLALLCLPGFESLVARDLPSVLTSVNLAAMAALGVVVGVGTAIYPAWVALRVRPAHMLAGRGDGESSRGRLARRVLSTAQLAIAMGLGGVSLAISLQARHAMVASPGFDPANKLVLELPIGMSAAWTPQATAFITEATQHPAVAGIAVANTPVGENLSGWATDLQREGGEKVFLEVKGVSPNYFELHGVAAVSGRLFRSTDPEEPQQFVVLNAEAARVAGFSSPELAVGQTVKILDIQMAMSDRTVIGIAPEIRFHSLREPSQPLMYLLTSVGSTLTAQARGTYAAAEQALRDLWPRYFPNAPFEPRAARDVYAANYAEDARLAKLLAATTLIALLIAACGAYVVASDAVQRRVREIALRKLFGARGKHVSALIARELGVLLLIAALVALPLSALAIARYLAPFTDQTPLAHLPPLAAAFVAAVVVALAAARETWVAIHLRPAAALRT